MEEFSDVRFKQRAVIELLTAEKVPPNEIHRRMQAVYGIGVFMWVQKDGGQGGSKMENWGKQIWVTKHEGRI